MKEKSEGVETLIMLAQHSLNIEVRLAAIVGLGHAGGYKAREYLISLLQYSSTSIYQKAAAIALGRVAHDIGEPKLSATTHDLRLANQSIEQPANHQIGY